MNLNTAGWASRALTPLLRVIRGSINATVPVVAISEPVNSETAALVNADIALIAKGTGATLAQVPDGTTANGNKRGIYATDWQKARLLSQYVASGSYSVIGGGDTNVANSQYATVAGGSSNGAQANYAAITGGTSNTATNTYSYVGGGSSNTASGLYTAVLGGISNTASGSGATCIGNYGTTRSIQGNCVISSSYSPITTTAGAHQSAFLILARQTVDATATVLTSNSSAASTNNQVILPNNSAYYFRGSVISGVTGGGDSKAWTFEGAIKRGATAASTTIVGTVVVNVIAFDAGASAWTIAVTADTTNGGLAVTFTGAAATTIRTVAKIETTEMTY